MYKGAMKTTKALTTCCGMEFSVERLERMAQVLKLLAHPQRLQIIGILDRSGGAPVHQIVAAVGLTQGATSQHLNQMKRVGLVVSERRGKEVWYRIGDESALTILNCMKKRGAL